MALIAALAISVGYGIYHYAVLETARLYLWPVVDVVPGGNGTYYTAIINTGHVPFIVTTIVYKTGIQSVNNNTPLYQNQYLLLETNQSPVGVMVCSATTPDACIFAKPNNWTTINQLITGTSGSINLTGAFLQVTVNDVNTPTGTPSWNVTWWFTTQNPPQYYSISKSTSYTWYINLATAPYIPAQVSFQAKLLTIPQYYSCTISPSSITAYYNPGSTQTFAVTCTPLPITISVVDNLQAIWSITWTGAASGSKSGTTSTTFTVQPSTAAYTNFTASTTNSSCKVIPSSANLMPGQSQTFQVVCYGSITVSITNDNYQTGSAGWKVTWSDTQGVVSGSNSGSGNTQWVIYNVPYGDQVNLQASITSNPWGYTCSISPSSTSATPTLSSPNQQVTFTVSCSVAPIYVLITDEYYAPFTVYWTDVTTGQSGSFSSWENTFFYIYPSSPYSNVYFSVTVQTPPGYSYCYGVLSSENALPGDTEYITIFCQ